MKVSELKPGMLLRFKKPMGIKYVRDHEDHYWLDFARTEKAVDPLVIYLGQKQIPDKTYYGGYRKVRQVSLNGKTLWMWPDAWKHLEPAEKEDNGQKASP
tara:strand:- start:387 stop:686 length:300 start_codon:yes stop_codon:yes gene_type:complete